MRKTLTFMNILGTSDVCFQRLCVLLIRPVILRHGFIKNGCNGVLIRLRDICSLCFELTQYISKKMEWLKSFAGLLVNVHK